MLSRAQANCNESPAVIVARIDATKRVTRGTNTNLNANTVAIQTDKQNGHVNSSPTA